ncbi:MAG TPA: hypothetical protein VIN07_13365 [Flavipsychrobacter sp.]
MNAADKYYLKAKDNYPYNLEEALEALDYGLSHDDTHAGLLVLQGKIYYRDLSRFDAARENFELALYHEPGYIHTYYEYIRLAVMVDDFTKTEKLIRKALTVPGIDKSRLYYYEAQMLEKQGAYTGAIAGIKKAMLTCQSKDCHTFYSEELERLLSKNTQSKEDNNLSNIAVKYVG